MPSLPPPKKKKKIKEAGIKNTKKQETVTHNQTKKNKKMSQYK